MATRIAAVRTPDERFAGLPGWPYEPHYISDLPGFDGLRIHYADVPARGDTGRTVLCLHGQPTWSYLYRRMIPVFAAAGHRVIAPDLLGFGRSDKPVDDAVYTFSLHRESLCALFERLDLERVTLVVQDWGGLLGLTLPLEFPGRIDRLVVMNTGLAVGRSPGPGFDAWKAFVASKPDFDIPATDAALVPALRADEAAAYGAPFPDARVPGGRASLSGDRTRRAGHGRCRRLGAGRRVPARAMARTDVHGDRHAGPGARRADDARTGAHDPQLSATAGTSPCGTLRPGVGNSRCRARIGRLR